MITYFPHIFFPSKFVGAAFCEKDYLAEMKRLKIDNPIGFVFKAASVRCYKKDDGDEVYIICFDAVKNKQASRNSIAALIAHEATHVSDYIFESIGEDKPGMETRAYLVQYIVGQALNALDDFTKKVKGRK